VSATAEELTAADAQRWADAEALVNGTPTTPDGPRGWRSPSRRLTLYLALTAAAALAIGVLVVVVFGGRTAGADRHDVAGWRQVAGLILIVVGIGFEVVTFVRARRTRAWNWSSPTAVLSWRQRRRVGRQLRGKAPVLEDELVVLRAAAEFIGVQSRNTQPLVLGLVIMNVGQVVQSTSAFVTATSVVVLVVFAWVAVLLPRSVRQMGAFLDEHPAPTAAGGV
jgi:hypothetical protein